MPSSRYLAHPDRPGYYWQCRYILIDLAITGNGWCFARSDLICDVPLTRNFNLDAEDGNSASKFITWLKSDTHLFSVCISIRQKTFLQPQTKHCLLPMSYDASKCWSAFKPGQRHHRHLISITERTSNTNSCLQCRFNLFLANNLLRIKSIFCHSLIHTTVYGFFPQHISYVHRRRQSCSFCFCYRPSLCTVLSFCYRPCTVYSPFLLL